MVKPHGEKRKKGYTGLLEQHQHAGRTTEAGVCGTPSSSDAKDAPEPPKAQEVDVAKTLPAKEPAAEVKPSQAHKAAFRVPRATWPSLRFKRNGP